MVLHIHCLIFYSIWDLPASWLTEFFSAQTWALLCCIMHLWLFLNLLFYLIFSGMTTERKVGIPPCDCQEETEVLFPHSGSTNTQSGMTSCYCRVEVGVPTPCWGIPLWEWSCYHWVVMKALTFMSSPLPILHCRWKGSLITTGWQQKSELPKWSPLTLLVEISILACGDESSGHPLRHAGELRCLITALQGWNV